MSIPLFHKMTGCCRLYICIHFPCIKRLTNPAVCALMSNVYIVKTSKEKSSLFHASESRRLVRAGGLGPEVWFLSRFCKRARASVMEPGLPRYRDRAYWSPKRFPHREIIRVVPRINDSSLEPKGSGDFLFSARSNHYEAAQNQ